MLTVKTSLRPSAINGLGVFADEFIPEGATVWRYVEGFDTRLGEDFVSSLPEQAQKAIRHYSAFWNGGYVVSADDSRFINHSNYPNLKATSAPDEDIALRDIYPGEELTEDYRDFDEKFEQRIFVPNSGKEAQTASGEQRPTSVSATGASGQPSGSLASQSPAVCPECGAEMDGLHASSEGYLTYCTADRPHKFCGRRWRELRQFFPSPRPADTKELAQRIADAVNKWYESPNDKCELGELIEQELTR